MCWTCTSASQAGILIWTQRTHAWQSSRNEQQRRSNKRAAVIQQQHCWLGQLQRPLWVCFDCHCMSGTIARAHLVCASSGCNLLQFNSHNPLCVRGNCSGMHTTHIRWAS
jgi:hypothetical protein